MTDMAEQATVALVTGGGRGIGREIVAGLAARGCAVLIGARDPDGAQGVAAALRGDGGDVSVVALDVTDAASVAAAAKEVEARFGRLDVLVNNAGIPGDLAAQQPGAVDLATVQAVFATNVFGVISVTEAMLPLLRRSRAGRIVNLSSSIGSLTRMSDPADAFAPRPGIVGYPPSKAALNQLTVQYAKALRSTGILVNSADPGACATDFAGAEARRRATRSAADGAAIAIRLATLPADGPTAGYFADTGVVPW